jgi:hypothetical protein
MTPLPLSVALLTATPERLAMAQPYALENQLLLCCARLHLDDATKAFASRLVDENLDWLYLLRTALNHGVGPLLYVNLRAMDRDTIPPAALSTLRLHMQQVFITNSLMVQELLKILTVFDAHHLYAIPYKGPTLGTSAYGNLALRPFGDLDIWIPQHDLKKGKALLLSLGYQPGIPDNGQGEDTHIRTHHDYPFFRKEKDIVLNVELQWGVTEAPFSCPIAFQPLWERRQTVSLGRNVPSLCVEDTLLVLCIHGTKHGWNKLMWICDIAALLRPQTQIDWTTLVREAEKLGGSRMLFFGLHLANVLLDALLPPQISRRINANPFPSSLVRHVRNELFRGTSPPSWILEENPYFYLRLRERWQDKLRLVFRYGPYYARRMFTPNELDVRFCPLPRSLFFLYYILHPVRLIGVYARQLFQRKWTS